MLKNPKRIKSNNPVFTLIRNQFFFWGGGGLKTNTPYITLIRNHMFLLGEGGGILKELVGQGSPILVAQRYPLAPLSSVQGSLLK